MKRILFLLLLASFCWDFQPSARGQAVEVISPDQAVAPPKSTLKDHTLFWNKSDEKLIVTLSFGDEFYTDSAVHDETFHFVIPGVSFDARTKSFTVSDGQGGTLPIAHRRDVAFLHDIKPTPNAFFRIRRDKDKVSVLLEVYRPEVAEAMRQMPDSDEKTVRLDSLFK